MTAIVTLIGKPDCHLCDDARAVIETVLQDVPRDQISRRELSILDDEGLHERWWEKIPVVMVNDQVIAHWRIDADRLRAALAEAGAPR